MHIHTDLNVRDYSALAEETINQDPKKDPAKKPLLNPEVDPDSSPDENPGINPTTNPERFDDEPDPYEEPQIGDDPDEERKKLPTMGGIEC